MKTDPRTIRSKQKVLDTTRGLLCQKGLNNMSVELIAAESGVAKTTIYRQWDNLDEIVFDVMADVAKEPKYFDTGSVINDAKASVHYLIKCLTNEDWSRMMPDIIERSMRDKKFKALKEQFMGERLAPLNDSLKKGVERGELKKTTDIPFVINQIVGPLFMSYMSGRFNLTNKQADTIVTNTLNNYLV